MREFCISWRILFKQLRFYISLVWKKMEKWNHRKKLLASWRKALSWHLIEYLFFFASHGKLQCRLLGETWSESLQLKTLFFDRLFLFDTALLAPILHSRYFSICLNLIEISRKKKKGFDLQKGKFVIYSDLKWKLTYLIIINSSIHQFTTSRIISSFMQFVHLISFNFILF